MSVRFAIDAVGAKHSGAATVLAAVVEAALRNPRVSRVLLYGSARSLRRFQLPSSNRLEDIEVTVADRTPAGRIWWHATGLQRTLGRARVDRVLALSGGGWGPPGCRSTLFIQQSLPFCPEAIARHGWAARVRLAAIGTMMRVSAARSDSVLVQTRTMREWVHARCGVPLERVEVVEPDVSITPREAPEVGIEALRCASKEGRAVLYVGNASPYKNIEVLGPAMEHLARTLPGAVLFGTFPPGHPVLRTRMVRALPYLSRGALREAYELAAALVMPSLVETVGLPMLEAAAIGTPVVAADRPYAHDVCEDAALYFDPLSPADLAQKLAAVMLDKALRARLVAAGTRNVERRAAGRPYERMVDLAIGE